VSEDVSKNEMSNRFANAYPSSGPTTLVSLSHFVATSSFSQSRLAWLSIYCIHFSTSL